MPYQLVLQFAGATIEEFDALIAFEGELLELFENKVHCGKVDGHDFGQNEMNIFVITNDPQSTLTTIQQNSENSLLNTLRAGFRKIGDNIYTPLFPATLNDFHVM